MAFSEVANGSVLVDVHENRLSLRNVRKDRIVTDRATLMKGEGIQVIWPNGGERLQPGESQSIRWTSVGEIGNVDVSYSCDNGDSWIEIENDEQNDGAALFDFPDIVGDSFRVRVQSTEEPDQGDISDARFEVGSVIDSEIFPFGSDWRYHDSGQDLGSEWLAIDYDDSGWLEGPGQLGYGDGDEATVLHDEEPDNFPSVYFRKIVELDALPDSSTMGLLYDDAAAVWINESLIGHVNFGNGSSYSAWSSSSSDDNETLTESFDDIPWVVGENIIAVMVKQRSADSSDLSFDMSFSTSTRETEGFSACPDLPGDSGGADSGVGASDAGDSDCGCSAQQGRVYGFGLLGFVAFILRRRKS